MTMGLLGDDFSDPQTLAVLQLAGGLLSPGSFGQGLQRGMQGYQGALMNAQDIALKKQQVLSAQQEQQVRDLQIRQTLQKLALGDQFLGVNGESSAPPASPASTAMGLGAQAGSIGPTVDNAQRMNSLPQTPTTVTPQQQSKLASMTQDQIAAGVVSGVIPKELVELWTNAKFGRALPPGWKQQLDGTMIYVPDPTKGVTMGPDGKTVVQMPGAAGALGGIAGAVKAGETQGANENTLAPLDRINPATGRPYNMTVGGMIRQINGEQPAPTTPAPASLGDFDPATQARIQASMRRNGDTNVAFQKAMPTAPASFLPPSLAVANGGGFNGFQGPAEAARDKAAAEKGVGLEYDPLIRFKTERLDKAHSANQAFVNNLDDTVRNEAELQNRNNQLMPLLDRIKTGGFGAEERVRFANALQTSNLPISQATKDSVAKMIANGDPDAGKVLENQLAAAGIKTMLDTLDKEGKPNRAIFQAIHDAQESLKSGNVTLKQVFTLQKQLYDWHYQQQDRAHTMFDSADYNPLTFQREFSQARNQTLTDKPALAPAAPATPASAVDYRAAAAAELKRRLNSHGATGSF